MNVYIYVIVWTYAFISVGQILRSGMAGIQLLKKVVWLF